MNGAVLFSQRRRKTVKNEKINGNEIGEEEREKALPQREC
jgi:hypothetical protein